MGYQRSYLEGSAPLFTSPGVVDRRYMEAINAEIARMSTLTYSQFKQESAKPAKGDKVRITIEGYVTDATDDVLTVVDKRTPFPGDAKVIASGPFKEDNVTVRVVERAPVEPRVGDTITGATLKATAWKRGTIISYTDLMNRDVVTRWVLLGSGEWTNLNNGTNRDFAAFNETASYVVEYAPGKKTA